MKFSIPGSLGRPYYRWLVAHTASQLGLKFASVALPVLALKTANASASQMGLITAATSVAYVLLALPAGARIEAMPKQTAVMWSGRIRMVSCVAIIVVALTGQLSVLALTVFALLVGMASVVYDIGLTSGLAERVSRERLVDANRGFEVVQHVSIFVGPALAGLIGWLASPLLVLGFEAAFFAIASLAAAGSSPVRFPERNIEEGFMDRLKAGMHYCWYQSTVRHILATILLSSFSATVIFTLEPIIILKLLHGTPLHLSLCLIAGSLGGLVSALQVRSTLERYGRRPLMIGGLLGAAFCTGGIAIAAALAGKVPNTFLIFLISAAQFGIAFCIVHFNIVQVTVRQEVTPLHMMARMSAVSKFFIWCSMPVASVFAGWAASKWGVVPVIVASFIGAMVTALPVLRVKLEPTAPPSDA